MTSQLFAHGFAHGPMPPLGFFPFGLLNAVGGVLVLAGLALFVLWAVRALGGSRLAYPGQPVPAQPSALDILQRRFAAGEISAEEYARSRDILAGVEPPQPRP